MTALRVAWLRLWAVFGGSRRRRVLDEEIETHLALLAEQHRAEGMSDAEARAAARRSFGGVDQMKETWRDERSWPFINSIAQDLRFAVRILSKDRRLALGAIVALGLGIGVNNMVFTFVNTILFRELPLMHPEQLVALNSRPARGPQRGLSYLDFRDVTAASHSFRFIAARAGNVMNVGDDDLAPQRFRGGYVSPAVFAMYGVTPVIGRGLEAADDEPGAPPVVVISDRVWSDRYKGDPAILKRTIRVNGAPAAVVGVTPAAVRSPLMLDEVLLPLHLMPGLETAKRDERTLTVDGRLNDGLSMAGAQAELAAIGNTLAVLNPSTNREVRLTMMSLDQVYRGVTGTAPLLITMMATVVFVLLIACANVANLLLARSVDRSREIAVRASLGASRLRLIRQLFIESLVLGAAAGLCGLLLSVLFVKLFSVVFAGKEVGGTETFTPYWVDLSMDWRVFTFLAMLCLATTIIFGFAPAVHLSKAPLTETLREGARGVGVGKRTRRWSQALVVGELALAVVLLAGAGLMVRSAFEAYRRSLAFDTSNLMTMRLTLPAQSYPTPALRDVLLSRLEDRLASNPAIASATLVSNIPFVPGGVTREISLDGHSGPDGAARSVMTVSIDTRYFRTLGVSLLHGRDFSDLDRGGGQEGVIINQRLAATFFPGIDPIGRRIQLGDATPTRTASAAWYTVVGVAATIPQFGIPGTPGLANPGKQPEAVAYVPLRGLESAAQNVSIIVRGRTPDSAVDSVRKELRTLDPDMPLYFIRSMDDAAEEMQFQIQGMLRLFGFFAGIAFVLAAVGLYGVTAHTVTQRTTEIGVRMALGASRAEVVWLFLRRTLVQIGLGLAGGLAGALLTGRVIQSVLVQTSPRDPLTLTCVALILVVVSLAAAVIPARRAARLDPAITLRYE